MARKYERRNKAIVDYTTLGDRKVLPLKLDYKITVQQSGKINYTEREMRWRLEDEGDLWEKDGFPTIEQYVRSMIEDNEGFDPKSMVIDELGTITLYDCHREGCKGVVGYTVDGELSCERHMIEVIGTASKPVVLPHDKGKWEPVDRNASMEDYFPKIEPTGEAPKADGDEASA